MSKLWDGLLGLLAPGKYLHNRSLQDGEAHEQQRHLRNVALAEQCLLLAQQGAAVELRCTNSGWVELRVMPGNEPAFTYNGRTTDVGTEIERRH